ncbi:MAG: type II toxin-antitoxin system Phd/YefM family antitoxin [Actinobacteria bacterium]|nr:type II toxin-antitoxin system Phd/YefM family antitoxin [Actinomycetota bacterium]MBI3688080.1 type II toxin-antitoxin system Phd/YefM family antitoxin [Actinomycetota bacterium]
MDNDTTCGYARSMNTTSVIPSRDLRNHTADVLRRVEAGEEIEILHNNRPIAKLVPLRTRRRWIPATEVLARLNALGPDRTGAADELRDTLTDTTDDLPW